MSRMSELSIEIETMLGRGTHPATISAVLEVPVSWVYEVLDHEKENETEEFDPLAP